ncbi:LysR family transcriptional regulator [Frigidibacter sp. MR17.24]|uniref:LysR family transcriptional regulator n=1 Tax=Frigidibacter sp. MR17.24 TaxID=3127345 RepID=UPI003012A613
MDVRDLSYLAAILREGSIVAAAEAVGRTPPALTKAVRRLEEALQVRLFTRAGRGIEPTEAARYLVRSTAGMVGRLDVIRGQVAEIAAGTQGHVRLGVAATTAAVFLPGFLRGLSQAHPGLTISISSGMNDVLRDALRRGEIDISLGVIDRGDPGETETVTLIRDRVTVAASLQHRLQGRPVSFEEILAEKWVLPSRAAAMRQWFDAALVARGYRPPRPHVEASSIAILEELIAGTGYLSFISGLKLALPSVAGRLRALDLPGFAMEREIGASWMRGAAERPAVRLVTEALGRADWAPGSD